MLNLFNDSSQFKMDSICNYASISSISAFMLWCFLSAFFFIRLSRNASRVKDTVQGHRFWEVDVKLLKTPASNISQELPVQRTWSKWSKWSKVWLMAPESKTTSRYNDHKLPKKRKVFSWLWRVFPVTSFTASRIGVRVGRLHEIPHSYSYFCFKYYMFVFMFVPCLWISIFIKTWNLMKLVYFESVQQTAEMTDTLPCYLGSMLVYVYFFRAELWLPTYQRKKSDKFWDGEIHIFPLKISWKLASFIPKKGLPSLDFFALWRLRQFGRSHGQVFGLFQTLAQQTTTERGESARFTEKKNNEKDWNGNQTTKKSLTRLHTFLLKDSVQDFCVILLFRWSLSKKTFTQRVVQPFMKPTFFGWTAPSAVAQQVTGASRWVFKRSGSKNTMISSRKHNHWKTSVNDHKKATFLYVSRWASEKNV